jgi:hypothetical protein
MLYLSAMMLFTKQWTCSNNAACQGRHVRVIHIQFAVTGATYGRTMRYGVQCSAVQCSTVDASTGEIVLEC